MRAAALLMGLLLLTAGCLGMGEDDPEGTEDEGAPDAGDEPEDQQPSEDENGDSDDQTGDHEHEAQPEAHWDNRTGEVAGTNLVVESQGEAAVEEIELPNTTTAFAFNLTAEEGELDIELYPPGCEESDDEPGEDCSESFATHDSQAEMLQPDGGSAEWSTESPDTGTWTLRMWKADAGQTAVPYSVSFFYIDQHEPTPGHHS